ncbi:MAG: chromosome segregation protein SMC [Fimbriimonadales bacterium]|nr:MAG: chromosome segregation protein SMC [Fimbriimonadales bacterium]
MVQRLRLRNFRSFRDASVELRPLNILVGANASGKTNLVQAFRFLRDLARHGLEDAVGMQGGAEYLTNLHSREREVAITITTEPHALVRPKGSSGAVLKVESIQHELTIRTIRSKNSAQVVSEVLEARYTALREDASKTLRITRRGKIVRLQSPDPSLIHALFTGGTRFELDASTSLFELTPLVLGLPPFLYEANIAIYDFSPKQAKQAIPLTSPHVLSEDGANLPLVIQQLMRNPHQRERLLRLVQSVLPHIRQLQTTTLGGQHVQLQVQEAYFDRRALPAMLLSDGTVEIVALLVALFFSRSRLHIIEEPDRNLHPALMPTLVELLRDATEKDQVLITTHNPELIRHARLDELILVERDREGNSIIKRPADMEGVKIFLEEELGLDYLHTHQLLGV